MHNNVNLVSSVFNVGIGILFIYIFVYSVIVIYTVVLVRFTNGFVNFLLGKDKKNFILKTTITNKDKNEDIKVINEEDTKPGYMKGIIYMSIGFVLFIWFILFIKWLIIKYIV